MERPALRRYTEFRAVDFKTCPIWLNVHGEDEGKPRYRDTDEVTYRPWDRHAPIDLHDAVRPEAVVAARFSFADGRTATGFLSTPMSQGNFGDLQPAIFDPSGQTFVSLYCALRRLAQQSLRRMEEYFESERSSIFPIGYDVDRNLVTPTVSGVAHGVYFREAGQEMYL